MQQEPSGNLLGERAGSLEENKTFYKGRNQCKDYGEKKKQLFLPFVVILYKRTSKSLNTKQECCYALVCVWRLILAVCPQLVVVQSCEALAAQVGFRSVSDLRGIKWLLNRQTSELQSMLVLFPKEARSPDEEAFGIRIVTRVTELTSHPCYCDTVAA